MDTVPFVTKQFAVELLRFANEAIALSKQLDKVDELTSEYPKQLEDIVQLVSGRDSVGQMVEYTPLCLTGVYSLLAPVDIDLMAAYQAETGCTVLKLKLDYPYVRVDHEEAQTLYLVPKEDEVTVGRYLSSQILSRTGKYHCVVPFKMRIPDLRASSMCPLRLLWITAFAPGGINRQAVPVFDGTLLTYVTREQDLEMVKLLKQLERKKNDKIV